MSMRYLVGFLVFLSISFPVQASEIADECTDPKAFNSSYTKDDSSCVYPHELNQPPAEFDFTPTPMSGTFYGTIQIDGVMATGLDWVAAFDEAGNCAGANSVLINEGVAYVILTIYGDDLTTSLTDEGLTDGDDFTLQIFDATTLTVHEYYEPSGAVELGGWLNVNGAPLPDYSNPNTIYNFLSTEYVPSCLDPEACNFDTSSSSNFNCIYPEIGYDCNVNCLNDSDSDGVCNEFEIEGCTDSSSCNFIIEATNDDGSCASFDECGVCGGGGVPEGECDCSGNQLDALGACGGPCSADTDGDEICDDVDECVGALDACGICSGPGEVYECGCTDIPEGDCDCLGNQFDAIDVCAGTCEADVDTDGICDDEDDCLGVLDECGVCNGPGAVYECGCSDIPEGDCDCNGNILDTVGECGGGCTEDEDTDGICDDEDECVGVLDECEVCNGPGVIYTCGCADIPEGECDCNGNQLDALGVCGGNCASDVDADNVCDTDEISGCTDNTACNYDPLATDEDGSCTTVGECGICGGGGIPEGECDCDGNQVDEIGICGGSCIEDLDFDGICDVDEVWGCDDATAINFNPLATEDDGNCNYNTTEPDTFTFTPTPMSGTFYGTIQIDGVMATGLDWIAAFDETGNCAGANSVLMNEGVAYASLSIYGDDLTTSLPDEGMNPGETFTLVLYDASENLFITYVDSLGNEFLSGWENTYGAPIPGWNNPLTIFNFNNYVPCTGDFNEDGQVQLIDLLDILIAYGSLCNGCPHDLNNDGFVQVADLIDFLLLFGTICE